MRIRAAIFRPLHWFDRNERSTVTIGYLVIAMTLYATLAGVWNTGVVVDQKIRTQAVADAAAQGAAARMGAAINEMAMLNMLALRARAALTVGYAYIASSVVGILAATLSLIYYIAQFVISCLSLAPNPAWLVKAALSALDLAALIAWTVQYGKASLRDLEDVYAQVTDAQEALADNLTDDMREQLAALQGFIQVNGESKTRIYVSHPDASFYPTAGGDATTYLFNQTDYFTRLLMLATRVAFADAQWLNQDDVYSPEDPDDSYKFPVVKNGATKFFDNFRSTVAGVEMKMSDLMKITVFAALAISLLSNAAPQWGYKLKSQVFLSEWSGGDYDDRRMMQVIALAERIDSNTTFMAKGFFKPLNTRNSVVAVAQAEAGNTYDELLHYMVGDIPLLDQLITIPWRMWSTMGANYQGRLSPVDPRLVREALSNNTGMREAWEINTGGDINASLENDLFLH